MSGQEDRASGRALVNEAPDGSSPQAASIPDAIVKQVLAMGRAEWGATDAQVSADHIAAFETSLRLTREHFDLKDEPVRLHGLYLEGTDTILCHCGTSPNSGANAKALTGAWNWLHDQCAAIAKATQSKDTPQ